MVVDTCRAGEGCHVGAALAAGVGGLKVMAPLQVGGMAHVPPNHLDHGWPASITANPFQGCIRNLRVNGEVRGCAALIGTLASHNYNETHVTSKKCIWISCQRLSASAEVRGNILHNLFSCIF